MKGRFFGSVFIVNFFLSVLFNFNLIWKIDYDSMIGSIFIFLSFLKLNRSEFMK